MKYDNSAAFRTLLTCLIRLCCENIQRLEAVSNFVKNRLWHKCFHVNFVKFLRTRFFTEHLWTTTSAKS